MSHYRGGSISVPPALTSRGLQPRSMVDNQHETPSRCPRCGHEPPESSSFCNRCGSPLVAAAVVGERRPLTVMFCDLVGSTELAQALDAEELPLVIGEYQNSCAQLIRSGEGYVAEYLGDGLLVYFGYPHAHDDDAVRAVNAALAMLEGMPALNRALRRRVPAMADRVLEMRVGIHSGVVVLSDMGRGGEPHRFGVGDTLNIAARLEALAEAGQILISDSTQRLVSGAFELESLGATRLKGVEQPIELFLVMAAREGQSRLERSAVAGLTPLVGRTQEIALALERWQEVKNNRGQSVLLSGEPGIGKSRLVAEVRERLIPDPHLWLTCRCSSHRENTAFHPVTEMLERFLGVEEGDSQAERRQKVESGLGAAKIQERLISPLVGLLTVAEREAAGRPPGQGEDPRSQTLESLAECFSELSRDRPLVLVFEDLHWVDPSTLELLGLLMSRFSAERVLLLLTCRPEFELPWETGRDCVHIQLNPLTRDQVTELCRAVAVERILPASLLSELAAKTDGVPFFAEELTKAVLEANEPTRPDDPLGRIGSAKHLSVPSTLHESLMARLDRQGSSKELAQLCAVIGREASYELLRVVSERPERDLQQGLEHLIHANLISREGPPHQARYVFRHALIHETAYDSLLRGDRQSLHHRIARALSEQFPNVGESQPEELARHYALGGHPAKAVPMYSRAAELAIDRLAHLEAIGHLGKAIELVATLPATADLNRLELDLQIALGTSSMIAEGQGHDRVEQSHTRARELSLALGDEDGLFRALWGLSRLHQSRGKPVASHELGLQMLELAKRADDPARLCWAHLAVGQALFWRGNPAEALVALQATIQICDEHPDSPDGYMFGQDPSLSARALVGPVEWILGHVDRALQHGRQAVEVASKAEDPFTYAFVLNFASVVHQMRGEREQTLDLAEAAIEICSERGFPLFMGFGLVMKGWALCEGPEDGVGLMQEGLACFQDAHTGLGGPYLLALLTQALRTNGNDKEALAAVEAAMGLSAGQESYFWNPELLRLKSEVLVALDANARPESERLVREAIQSAREHAAVSFELRAAMSLYRLLEGSDRSAEAKELLHEACGRFAEGADTPDLADARALLSAG